MIYAVPIKHTEASEFVGNFHRHNKPPAGSVFCVGASDGTQLVGVAIVGRPVARNLDDGKTLEVTRCCVIEYAPKGSCSFLYARCWQAAKALGWQKLITYTLQSESGASLRGGGGRLLLNFLGQPEKDGQIVQAGNGSLLRVRQSLDGKRSNVLPTATGKSWRAIRTLQDRRNLRANRC